MVEDMIFRMDYKKLANILEEERKNGKKIVMASGTFDLFHLGHMRMLAAAKKKGDILVVAVKSDRAAALKKEDPPVLDQEIRMETIANCISADYVVMADYDPLRLVPFEFKNTPIFWVDEYVCSGIWSSKTRCFYPRGQLFNKGCKKRTVWGI